MMNIKHAVRVGFEWGMFQHEQEIMSFLTWLDTTIGKPLTVLDIGGHRGGTFAMWCAVGAKKVVGVDMPDGPWGGIGLKEASQRNHELACLFPAFQGVLGDSQDYGTLQRVDDLLGLHRVDVLFIDGDHSYLGVKSDYTMYRTFVRKGGIIAFHDINDTKFHRDRGVMVSKLWQELKGNKHEFTVRADWGGIGAIVV